MAKDDARPYLALVEHDLKTLEILSVAAVARSPPVDVSDWKCTLMYYMACLYVKALGRSRGKDLQDHYQIKQWLNTEPDLVAVARPYRKLEERSRDARYEGRRFTQLELRQACGWFCSVRDRILELLRSAGLADAAPVDPSAFL